jgi:hypothetical protein
MPTTSETPFAAVAVSFLVAFVAGCGGGGAAAPTGAGGMGGIASGTSGTTGADGAAGASAGNATAAAGTTGAGGNSTAGTTGAAGMGAAGTTGAAGMTAAAGATGAAGAAGAMGGAGAPGTAGMTGTGGATGTAGNSGTGGSAGMAGTTGTAGAPAGLTADEVKTMAAAYKTAHPGNGGKDWDIVSCCAGASRTPASLAADAAAQRLLTVCGKDQLPVIPTLAWEYGGADHAWINPQTSAVVYCVYIPVAPASAHWRYDANAMRVTADIYVKFPAQNPCAAQTGAQQVLACLGDMTNIEVLVDTASFHDGADVGLSLSSAATDLNLILPNGSTIPLYHGT